MKIEKKIKQGSDLIDQHVDVVRFIRNQIKFEIFFKARTTKLERFFIRHNRKYVLDNEDSNSSDLSNLEYEDQIRALITSEKD